MTGEQPHQGHANGDELENGEGPQICRFCDDVVMFCNCMIEDSLND